MVGFFLGVLCAWVLPMVVYYWLHADILKHDAQRVGKAGMGVIEWLVRKIRYNAICGKTKHYEWDITYPRNRKMGPRHENNREL